jgi:hypothetical protein
MTTELNLAQVAAASGATEVQINNWLARGALSATAYNPQGMGKARKFTRENVLEITLMARLVASGLTPAAAATRIDDLFKEIRRRKPTGHFMFFGSTGDFFVVDDEPNVDRLRKMGVAVMCVNIAQLQADVDRAFEDADR